MFSIFISPKKTDSFPKQNTSSSDKAANLSSEIGFLLGSPYLKLLDIYGPETQLAVLKILAESLKKLKNPLKDKNGNLIFVKKKIFPQSYAIDAMLAQKQLEKAGHNHIKLDNMFLYRGDTRAPDGKKGIFEVGFYRQIEDEKYHQPKITDVHSSEECIATSKDLIYAVGFADTRAQETKSKESWVYLLYSPKGIDLTIDSQNQTEENIAKLINEVTLTGVPPEQIIAAFKIKPTSNRLDFYYEDLTGVPFVDLFVTSKIPASDLKINEKCKLKEEDPKLYNEKIKEFTKSIEKGYFQLPFGDTNPVQRKTNLDLLVAKDNPLIADTNKLNQQKLPDFGFKKGFLLGKRKSEASNSALVNRLSQFALSKPSAKRKDQGLELSQKDTRYNKCTP